jgi:hypothetical protein
MIQDVVINIKSILSFSFDEINLSLSLSFDQGSDFISKVWIQPSWTLTRSLFREQIPPIPAIKTVRCRDF